jgi:HAD superfamily hydrolase (TIGR01484 family)
MKKAIIFDVDGTAMPIGDEFGVPSVRLKQVVSRLMPTCHVSVATGRSLFYAKHVIEFLELTDLCIIASGTEIYDPASKKVVWREPIPPHAYEHIATALKDNQDEAFSGDNSDDGITGATVSELLHNDVSVIYIIGVDPLEATELTNKLQHPELHTINMHSFSDGAKRDLHIHSVKASKEHAVGELLRRLGVTKENSTVIGDGLNDLHLFVAGGTKVAMGNAVPELKEAADLVIKSVSEDGLADYLESLAKA